MVLDKIISTRVLREKPFYAIHLGFWFVMLGYFSTLLIFKSQISLVMVALSSLFMLPYIIKIFEYDELDVDITEANPEELKRWVSKCFHDGYSPEQIKEALVNNNADKPYDVLMEMAGVEEAYLKYTTSSNFFTRHWKIVSFYIHLFLGSTMAYMLLFGVLRPEYVNVVFENQLSAINPHPLFIGSTVFSEIVSNNLKIALICVLLSLLYGSGAIFILNYNASIAAVMYGSSIRSYLWGSIINYPNLISYLPHTTIEVLAYLLAAIAGGILSKATMNVQPGSIRIWIKDGLILLALSIILIVVAALIEVRVLSG